ncbi:hypothetical protein Tco_0809359 [Tanacetum coccineum]
MTSTGHFNSSNSYLEHVTEYQRYLNEQHDKADDKSPEPMSSQPPKPTPKPTEYSKKDQGKKHKLVMESTDAPSPAKQSKSGKVTKKRMPKSSLQLVDEVVDEGVPEKEPAHDDEEANLQRALELKVQGKGKEKVAKEQVAHDLLTLQTPKLKNLADQFIFQRRTPMPTEPSEHADSPSLDAKLALTDSETKSMEEVPVIKAGDQDEGQAGPNPGEQDKGQAGSNPGDVAESQPQPSHVENLKLLTEDQVILEEPASSTRTLSSLQNLDKDLSFTDQFFVEKPQEEEPGKTNAEAEVQSMVSVPIHQDTSSVPPMTTPIIDLTKSDIKQLGPGKRLDKHGSRLYKLENLNIPHQVSKAVDEIVTDAVDWAMQAPLQARFKVLPSIDIKEILQQWMFEDNTYKTHEVHNDLYDALQKSFPPPPTPPSPGTSGFAQQQGIQASSSSKNAASASQSMAWTTSDTQYKSADIPRAQELSPTDYLIPATPEPAWTIPSSNKSDVVNNWASALATTYEPPAENSLLANIGDMTTFMNWSIRHRFGDQDEGQVGPNPGKQDESQAGPNPGDDVVSQPQPSHVVHVGPNLEHMDLETTDASTQQKLEQMDEEFTTTAYPNVQENLKLLNEDQVILEEPASSTGSLSSLQNLDKDLSFTDQFFVEKP